jgi:hypothetical protein
MTRKAERKPKLTDAERHKRFLEMAREVKASDDPKDFDEAFKKIVPSTRQPGRGPKGQSDRGPADKTEKR